MPAQPDTPTAGALTDLDTSDRGIETHSLRAAPTAVNPRRVNIWPAALPSSSWATTLASSDGQQDGERHGVPRGEHQVRHLHAGHLFAGAKQLAGASFLPPPPTS